jgi:hypothetical protein
MLTRFLLFTARNEDDGFGDSRRTKTLPRLVEVISPERIHIPIGSVMQIPGSWEDYCALRDKSVSLRKNLKA